MPNEITIVQMSLADRDTVLAFLTKAYPDNDRPGDAAFWDWHFQMPPNVGSGGLPVWLAKSGDRIAGQLGAIPVDLNVRGRTRKAMWILDLVVDPDFRRMGIAKNLVREAEEYCPLMLGVNTNEQHAPALLQSLGFVIVTKIPRFHKLLFPGNTIKEIARSRPLRSAVNAMFAPLRRRRLSGHGSESLRILNGFDSAFDELWSDAQAQWPCAVSRSAAMLKWQFMDQPGKTFDILGYFDGGKLLGYAVLYFRKPTAAGVIDKAAISDIVYHPSRAREVVDGLIAGSLNMAVERQAGGLVADALDPLLQDRLKAAGFWRLESGLQLMAKAPDEQDVIYDGANWFLTRGDSDISIFERPNI